MKNKRFARKARLGVVALLSSAILVATAALPASAYEARYGSKSCSTLVNIASNTVAVPTQTFYQTGHYAVPGGTRTWGWPGFHSNRTSAYSTNWSIITDGDITSSSVTCSGVG
ncbi:MAG: hypothetical protein RL499_249 [Actinomycetota bacterium]|jgi:hypothetical protein